MDVGAKINDATSSKNHTCMHEKRWTREKGECFF